MSLTKRHIHMRRLIVQKHLRYGYSIGEALNFGLEDDDGRLTAEVAETTAILRARHEQQKPVSVLGDGADPLFIFPSPMFDGDGTGLENIRIPPAPPPTPATLAAKRKRKARQRKKRLEQQRLDEAYGAQMRREELRRELRRQETILKWVQDRWLDLSRVALHTFGTVINVPAAIQARMPPSEDTYLDGFAKHLLSVGLRNDEIVPVPLNASVYPALLLEARYRFAAKSCELRVTDNSTRAVTLIAPTAPPYYGFFRAFVLNMGPLRPVTTP